MLLPSHIMDSHRHTFTALAVTITLAVILTTLSPASSAPASLPPYTNHTVGGSTGWFFDAKKNSSAVDYSKWANSQSFYLGDFLIFKTNSNMSVIQTYNETTYRQCDASEDGGDDTFVYGSGGRGQFGVAAVIAVPLTEEGGNYFFSGSEDGIQCAKGMRFKIGVQKGRGLPPALSQPPPPPMVDVQVPPPPDTEIAATGGGPQGESFYTGGAGRGVGGWEMWGLGFLGVLLIVA